VERTQTLGEYLSNIKPEDLHKHSELVDELKYIDSLISKLSTTLSVDDEDSEVAYREALVKVMQDCHYYWQKITGESIIDLAEKSRIWSVSVDNGRLRTRSMNRYLSLEKLPANPRWRQVARTAYFVLSKVNHDEEARDALETSVGRLQEIVEQRALN
jgi:two-component system, sensor histidine kinase LadS